MIISIYRSIYSCIESNRIVNIFEELTNIVSLGMRIDIKSNCDKPSHLYIYIFPQTDRNILTKQCNIYGTNIEITRMQMLEKVYNKYFMWRNDVLFRKYKIFCLSQIFSMNHFIQFTQPLWDLLTNLIGFPTAFFSGALLPIPRAHLNDILVPWIPPHFIVHQISP